MQAKERMQRISKIILELKHLMSPRVWFNRVLSKQDLRKSNSYLNKRSGSQIA